VSRGNEPDEKPKTELGIFLDGDGALDDWSRDAAAKKAPKIRWINEGLRVIRLVNGTSGGHNAVSVCGRSPSGQVIVLEMTERLFLLAALAIQERSRADGTLAPDVVDDGGDVRIPDETIAAMTPDQLAKFEAMLDAQMTQVLAARRRKK
jgi:hypothetical protein